jgi:hypothetical protein
VAWLVSGNDLPFFPYPLNDYFTVFHGSTPLPWSRLMQNCRALNWLTKREL